MLNIGGAELLIILLVALVFLGPQRLPEVARQVGQTVTTLRGLARGFQAELEAAAKPDPGSAAAAKPAGVGEPPALKNATHGPSPRPPQDALAGETSIGDAQRALAAESGDELATGWDATEPSTNRDELAAKARDVSYDRDPVPMSPGGPTSLVDEEE